MSWCTVWKGTPQDCMDHVRGAHDVPWDVKSASLDVKSAAVDSSTPGVVGFLETAALGNLDGHFAVQ